ncbi:MAG: hypothetical protein AAF488_18420, partial [Planctomycetota bacterium]
MPPIVVVSLYSSSCLYALHDGRHLSLSLASTQSRIIAARKWNTIANWAFYLNGGEDVLVSFHCIISSRLFVEIGKIADFTNKVFLREYGQFE